MSTCLSWSEGDSVNRFQSVFVGVLVAFVVFGGVQVVSATTSSPELKICVNKTTGAMRNIRNSESCNRKTERAKIINQTGASGAAGGAAITQQSICGAGGTSLCKIGVQGPGGGTIFFVDYNDQFTGFNYLEFAPQGWGNGITVNQGGLSGEKTGTATVDPLMKWCSDVTSLLLLEPWGKSGFVGAGKPNTSTAVGAGASNTSTADGTCAGGAIQAAADYAGGSKTDWFLPSIGEAMLMYTNLRQADAGGFVFGSGSYWSSSESHDTEAWYRYFYNGAKKHYYFKNSLYDVRPVRAF